MFTEEQWEKELDNELQEFELVDNGGGGGASNNDDATQSDDWEKDADKLLGDDDADDDEDLKWKEHMRCVRHSESYQTIFFLFNPNSHNPLIIAYV